MSHILPPVLRILLVFQRKKVCGCFRLGPVLPEYILLWSYGILCKWGMKSKAFVLRALTDFQTWCFVFYAYFPALNVLSWTILWHLYIKWGTVQKSHERLWYSVWKEISGKDWFHTFSNVIKNRLRCSFYFSLLLFVVLIMSDSLTYFTHNCIVTATIQIAGQSTVPLPL